MEKEIGPRGQNAVLICACYQSKGITKQDVKELPLEVRWACREEEADGR